MLESLGARGVYYSMVITGVVVVGVWAFNRVYTLF
jgi:hypothetical protein